MAFLLHDLLRETAGRTPDATALIAGNARRSFAALDAESDALAHTLQELGIVRGDRVAVMLDNSVDYVAALFGILKAGGVYVPVNPSTRPDKLAFLLADCGVKALFTAATLARVVLPALPQAPSVGSVVWVGRELPPGATATDRLYADAVAGGGRPAEVGGIDGDLAVIAYTSGTTGVPKGVMLTHANQIAATRAIAGYLGNRPDDVVLCVLPLTFGYGLSQVLTAALVGFTLVLERSFAFPAETLGRMVEHRVTGLPGVPTIFSTLLGLDALATADLSSLRYITNAAAPLSPAHLRRLTERFPNAAFYSMYGATECATRISFLDPARLADKPGSVGKAMPDCEAWIIDEDGRPAAPGVVGELVVRGANVMRGYWNQPEETARRLRDGVFHTGDLFRADEDGFLHFVGRKDDMFKCRGEKVSPKEVEAALYELPGIAEAAVLGVPDTADGMAVKAFIVPREGAEVTEAAIRQHCRGRLEGHLVPKFIEFRAELPKTDSGKVRRFLLAETV
ncbi:AMP-binding protein [Azospirillum sp. RWY-5-1]|uniref:AMP-binding protein n=1 Tax=Azospirillum oleiclasticum TaxID=2735135 RepID=A0ABX2TDQ2_9PROT|nr:AMP-binding protein [Azospirillum oleiclasticum]NYZ17965.1 AMP-binding protein [Azospirillum oleiclasticum]NYZ22408.1 AMP-binding protein [Azospirillum oleiclasticum]